VRGSIVALKPAPLQLRLALAAALLLSSSIGRAQSGGAAPPPWATDQAAGDAAAHNGQCQDALPAYDRALGAAQIGRPNAAAKLAMSNILVSEGNCLLKLHRQTEAEAAYERAAPLSPDPGVAYFNLCATYYNVGDMSAALPACDKAIQADPRKADAYFVKASMLVSEATFANGKYSVPPGALEALSKYLELAPNGPHAEDVRQMQDLLK
jgi:tetratricopeptide (TPR) repeat protein